MVSSQEKNFNSEKAKLELIERMSYEVKTALTSIMGFSNIVQNTCQNKKQLEHIANIINSSRELLDFANNMNDISKLMSGKYNPQIYSFSLQKLIDDVIKSFNLLINKKEISLHLKISECKIKNDNKITSQLLYSLFSHILKTTTQKGFVSITTLEIQDKILIEVKTNFVDFNNSINYEKIEKILECETNLCSQIDLFLIKQLTHIIGGEISFCIDKQQCYQIKILLPLNIS